MLVPMKKAELYALIEDKESILASLQKCGQFMIEPPDGDSASEGGQETENSAQRTLESIRFVTAYQKSKPLLPARPEVAFSQLLVDDGGTREVAEKAAALQDELSACNAEYASLMAQAGHLEVWEGLDIPLERIAPTRCADFSMGFVQPLFQEEAKRILEAAGAQVSLFGAGAEGTALFAAYHKDDAQSVAAAMAEANVQPTAPFKYEGTAREARDRLLKQAETAQKRAEELREKVAAIAERKQDLQVLYESQVARRDREQTQSLETAKAFYIKGWVRSDMTDAVERAVCGVTDAYELKFEDPSDDDKIPSVVKNNKVISPYEFVTDLYSKPDPRSLDPNPLMAPYFFIFFGMMVSDAVYGVALGLLAFAYLKLFKPRGGGQKLATVLMFGGVSTFIWGAMFGGWLGFELPPILFVPMNSPMNMLLLCFGLGLIQIIMGMCIRAYMDITRGHWQDALYDQFSWIMLIIGLLLLFTPVKPLAYVLVAVGLALILAFGGRDKKGFGRITGGLGALYNITGYFSDVLSYSRLFALGLATGVIGMVINTLCGMMTGAGIIGILFAFIVMVAGHSLNLAINTLGAYVHSSRLQYIEYYGKFFEAGGREFKPLAVNATYVDVK